MLRQAVRKLHLEALAWACRGADLVCGGQASWGHRIELGSAPLQVVDEQHEKGHWVLGGVLVKRAAQ